MPRKEFKLYSLDAELFAVGKWNGMSFSLDDLEEIAANFNELAGLHKVPLKLGHNDDQPLTDGQPALGWVTKVWVEGTKLMGRFEKVPELVAQAIKQQMYRRVSIELDIDVEHKGKKYRYVLSGVALLGADLPAVNTLADLDTYLDGESRLAASRRASFSAIQGQGKSKQRFKKESNMDEEDIKKMIKEQMAPIIEENKALAAKNAELTAQVAAFTKEKAEREAAEKASKIKLARETVIKVLDEGVKAEAITPAQRETFMKTLGVNDDERVLALNLDDVKALIPAKGKGRSNMSRQEGKGQGEGSAGNDRVHEDAGQEITRLARLELDKNPKIGFARAMEIVMERDPKLAREYVGGLNEEEAA